MRGNDDVSGWAANDEVDDVRWVARDKASQMLSYLDDIQLLSSFAEHPKRTSALIVVRHAEAVARKTWSEADPLRPLTPGGEAHACAIAPMLTAYGVRRLVSSPSTRCVQTLIPVADRTGKEIETVAVLSEEESSEAGIRAALDELLAGRRSAALCTHRPVLPTVLDLLGVSEEPLSPGEAVVSPHRRGRVIATERHLVADLAG